MAKGSGNISKSTNKTQLDILLNRMKENPNIARGFVKENRGALETFWKRVTVELNSAGPPDKNQSEWKKVWNDQKRYVRKKASKNRMHERGTGGGPNKSIKFSQDEEAIFELVGMREAIEGVGSSQSYGLAPRSMEKEHEDTTTVRKINAHAEEVAETSMNFPTNEEECNRGDSDPLMIGPSTSNQANQRARKLTKMSTNEVVLKELELQQELCAKVGEAVMIMKENSKDIQYAEKKICISLGRLEKQKKLEIKEMRRHNLVMEKLKKFQIRTLQLTEHQSKMGVPKN